MLSMYFPRLLGVTRSKMQCPTRGRKSIFRLAMYGNLASDILPIRLANDQIVTRDHPMFAEDLILQKLQDAKKDRTKELLLSRQERFGPVLAKDVLNTKTQNNETNSRNQEKDWAAKASVALSDQELAEMLEDYREGDELLWEPDPLLDMIHKAETTRIQEIVDYCPIFENLPFKDPISIASFQSEQPRKQQDTLVQAVQEAQVTRIDMRLKECNNNTDPTMATDVLPIQIVNAKIEKSPNLGEDSLLEKLQEIIAMRIVEYNENDGLSEKAETSSLESDQLDASSVSLPKKQPTGPHLASDVLLDPISLQLDHPIPAMVRKFGDGPRVARDILVNHVTNKAA